jgi:putative copper export protein
VEHVNTQLPYASAVAVIAILAYVVAGACVNLGSVLTALIMWVVALGLFVGFVFAVRYLQKKKGENEEKKRNEKVAKTLAAVGKIVILAIAVFCVAYGALEGGFSDVLTKAVNICTECIGLG